MRNLPPPPPPPPPGRSGGRGQQNDQQPPERGGRRPLGSGWPRWVIPVLFAVLMLSFALPRVWPTSNSAKEPFSSFWSKVEAGEVKSVTVNNQTNNITGELDNGEKFTTTAPNNFPNDAQSAELQSQGVEFEAKTPSSNWLLSWASLLLPLILLIGFFMWMQRRAAGQMGNVMSIGRSRAKAYTTDKPSTTFSDIAGYEGVKQEITEVVDFLRMPERFREIGARVPKGMLLVGPPGTGKTLIARAVAGEAGVPVLSVSGSGFMGMFVGGGASRRGDLFQSARKLGRAIIFVDEIDSIGRKRGAGLGGGHDEREQTLNQMLAEMDGFEATEGIVMMAATNRPDILDSALLRPGRFDRMIMVPLPTQEERVEILKVHFRDKKISPDVAVDVVARGTPGMSGADLANLVNEAALFAVRRNALEVHKEDFDAARDRVLMGLKRESLALSEEEKEIVAYHEGGHAVCAYVLEFADPLHKVTILPTGMALGVTQQLPLEERHIYKREYIVDSLVVRLGGRVAEELVFGHQSTGAENDLVGSTELARKMVREWGMSGRVGPMAWGSQGAVFLGEDLMHSRDYSDETARVIDEEVEHILRDEEDRCRKTLEEYRPGLDAVAQALLERETLSGVEVETIVDQAMGRKVGGPRLITRADGTEVPADPNLSPEDGLLGDLDTGASIATDTPLDPR